MAEPPSCQHRVFVLLVVAFGLFEWMVRTTAALAAVGARLLCSASSAAASCSRTRTPASTSRPVPPGSHPRSARRARRRHRMGPLARAAAGGAGGSPAGSRLGGGTGGLRGPAAALSRELSRPGCRMKLLRVLLLVLGVVFLGVLVATNDPAAILAAITGLSWRLAVVAVFPFVLVTTFDTLAGGTPSSAIACPFEGCWRCGSRASLQPDHTDGVARGEAIKAWLLRVTCPSRGRAVGGRRQDDHQLAQGLFSCSASSSRGCRVAELLAAARDDVAPHARGAGPRRLRVAQMRGLSARSSAGSPGSACAWRGTRRPARASIAAS